MKEVTIFIDDEKTPEEVFSIFYFQALKKYNGSFGVLYGNHFFCEKTKNSSAEMIDLISKLKKNGTITIVNEDC